VSLLPLERNLYLGRADITTIMTGQILLYLFERLARHNGASDEGEADRAIRSYRRLRAEVAKTENFNPE
jgi:hypothetical protein